MPLETMFSVANSVALAGWIALLASPFSPVWTQRIAASALPLLLAIGYTGLVLAFWSDGEGGFDTLEAVMALFRRPEIVLAGWIHYLAFDLFVGAWEVRTARAKGIPFWLTVPCLVLTFLLGPAGFLLFCALRAARALARPTT